MNVTKLQFAEEYARLLYLALVSEPVADIEGMNCPFWLTYRNVKKKRKWFIACISL